ncbi:hypothetical protein VN0472_06880 [Helicobacter pylori]|nr:hypothetical protein VN0472_06880 [Helicobacter pylori]
MHELVLRSQALGFETRLVQCDLSFSYERFISKTTRSLAVLEEFDWLGSGFDFSHLNVENDTLELLKALYFKLEKLESLPSQLGEKWCLNLSRLSHLVALVCWLCFVKCYHGGLFAYLGLGVSALILLYEQILVARDYKNIPKAFFVSNGYLGVVFFIFIVLDVGFKHA